MFFSLPEYKINPLLENLVLKGNILNASGAGGHTSSAHTDKKVIKKIDFNYKNIAISSPISFVISTITLVILLFLFMNKEWLSMGTILVQILFNN